MSFQILSIGFSPYGNGFTVTVPRGYITREWRMGAEPIRRHRNAGGVTCHDAVGHVVGPEVILPPTTTTTINNLLCDAVSLSKW